MSLSLHRFRASTAWAYPFDYENQMLSARPGMEKPRKDILRKLVDIQYVRNDLAFERGTFRVRGDVIDIYPAGAESAVRVELFGDEIESIKEMNPLTGEILGIRNHIAIYPASHYVTSPEKMEHALTTIDQELVERVQWFKDRGKNCWRRKGASSGAPDTTTKCCGRSAVQGHRELLAASQRIARGDKTTR